MYDDETYSHGYLMHFGRKGMKWHQHIFGGRKAAPPQKPGVVATAAKISDMTINTVSNWVKGTGEKAKRTSINTHEALGDINQTMEAKKKKGLFGIVRRKPRRQQSPDNYIFRDDKRAAAKKANDDGDVYVTTTNSVTGMQKLQKLNSEYTDDDLKRDMHSYGLDKVSKISMSMDEGKTYAESVISEHNKEVARTYAVEAAKTLSTVAVAAAAFGLSRLYNKRADEAPDSDADIDS